MDAYTIAKKIIDQLYDLYGKDVVDDFFINEEHYFYNDWTEVISSWSPRLND